MSYSDSINAQGLLNVTFHEALADVNADYLKSCMSELRKAESFFIFGGGDRAVTLARFLHSEYNLTASAFLINRRYNPNVGKMIKISDDVSIPIMEYESYIEQNQGTVIVLGVPKRLVNRSLLDDDNVQVVSFSFSTSIDGNFYLEPEYLVENKKKLDETFALLSDRYSQECFIACLRSRISGENIDVEPAPWGDPPYLLEDLMSWNETELFIDGGAYIGDFVDEIYEKMPDGVVHDFKVYSFEPDTDNYNVMCDKYGNDEHVIPLNKGLSSKSDVLYFQTDLAENGHVAEEGDLRIEVDSIDNILGSQKATFIKMDIEGSELEGLRGAREQIVANKPRLAVCLYHKKNDIFEIPLFIKHMRDDYKFYVRPHSSMPTELVLYCV